MRHYHLRLVVDQANVDGRTHINARRLVATNRSLHGYKQSDLWMEERTPGILEKDWVDPELSILAFDPPSS